MSHDEAEAIESQYDYWDAKHAKQDFIRRMEHKLGRKERQSRQ
jgi:hypothetical protein